MKAITRYIAVLLLLLSAVSAQAQTHKLTVVSTVGSDMSIIIYSHYDEGFWNLYGGNYNYKVVDNYVIGELAAGDSVKIEILGIHGWVYTHMECEGQKIFEGREVMYNSDNWPVFIMPDHDATIYAYAEFDPEEPEGGWGYGGEGLENPKSPNTNSWNAATGEFFVNYFKFNVWDYMRQNGFQSTDVKTITVSGKADCTGYYAFDNPLTLSSYNQFPNAEKLDLRHTFGYVVSWSMAHYDGKTNICENVLDIHLQGMPRLKHLILPSNIEHIGWWHLPQGKGLESITLYAPVPPDRNQSDFQFEAQWPNGFGRIPESCILYVPEQSVAAYKADTLWSNRFADILPIPEGEAEDITVDLPDNFTDGRYVGMSLLLFNARTGEQAKYIVDERPSYIFYSQTSDEPYTAQLLSPQGVLIASTDTVKLGNQPMEMTFKTVQPMHTVQLTVQTPAEQEGGTVTDVTGQTTIVWMDAMGNRIGTGNTLARQVEGTRLYYGITLPLELASHYGVPPRTELVVKEATAQTTITLAQPDSILLSGKVIDTERKPIAMATVTASLMMNGIVGKTFTTTTDMLGRYELIALTGDLTLSASASGYAAARSAVTVSGEKKDIDPFQLDQLSGPTIAYNFTYTKSTAKDEEATPLPYYSDDANVMISAYNETTGEALDNLILAYPEVQLLSGAKAGDRIRLTASSLKDAFMPVDVTVTLNKDEEKADSVTFDLKEFGGIEVSFLRTGNQEVTAALYDADGLLCRQEVFDEATLTLEGLKDGSYTLITMGSDPLLSKLLYLSDYRAVGLTEGTDYVSNRVKVESGMIAKVTNDLIPTLYPEQFYYTDDAKTFFMSNKTEVSTSCNVTLRAEIGFKEDIKERVSNVRLLVDYPAGMAEFVEGSSMTGTKMVRATMEDGHLSIPIERAYLDEPTRFILTAIDQGTLMASAQVQFDIDGRSVTQPIGIATCEVKYMTIVAPEEIYKLSFPVYGTAPALSPVRVYAGDDILVGETQSLADGSWDMHVELPDCPNLATIPVYAVITTKQGREAKTETVNVIYNQNMIRPLHVLMFPPLLGKWNNPKDYSSVISDADKLCIDFDYKNPMSLSEQWYSAYVHTSNPFLFEIIFNTTDPALVKNVALIYQTVKGEVGYLPAEYDGTTGHWMCSVNLQNDAVCTVDVDYLDETEPCLDADLQFANTHIMEYQKEMLTAYKEEVERIIKELVSETDNDKRTALLNELSELVGVDFSSTEATPSMTPEELDASITKMLEDYPMDVDAFIGGFDLYNMDMNENMGISHATGLDPQVLLDEGYTAITMTDGNTIYELAGENLYVMVDFQNDMRIEMKGEAAEALASLRRVIGEEDFMTQANRFAGEIIKYYNILSVGYAGIQKAGMEASIFFGKLVVDMGKAIEEFHNIHYAPGAPALTPQQQKHFVDMCTRKGIFEFIEDASSQMATKGLDVDAAGQKWAQLAPKTGLGKLVGGGMRFFSAVGKVFSYLAVLNDLKEGYDRVNELNKAWLEVPNPCKEDQANADALKKDIDDFTNSPWGGQGPYYIAMALADLAATDLMKIGVNALIPSLGSSMNTVMAGVTATLIKLGANCINDQTYHEKMNYYENALHFLNCDEEYKKQQDKWWRARFIIERREQLPKVRVNIDPSGYVYEAVADNRVENATATIYYKQTGEDEYGDQHDEVVKWNAAEFRQENPQLTDAEGKYAWDVPQGLWQVKIEKEGFETAYSDWLPVPPPQLDINIPLVRNTLPDVQSARAYEDGVEVTFNEYMRPESLTTERLMLSQNGEPVPCRIEQQNRSRSYDKKETYVSCVKVRTDKPLVSGSMVQLTVRRQVEAYNGLQMQHDYQQEFTVVSEVYAIGTDSIVEVEKGVERTITVHAFPVQAAAGMKLTAKSVMGAIATVTDEATFDTNGEAHLTVKGKMGGQTALLLNLENSKVKAQSIIQVDDPSMLPVYAPTSSHISGTYIKEGEKVTLHTDTKDATIWYTTDGTCPCDENGTRKQYTAPITITEAVTIRAFAVKGDDVSRVVSFDYKMYDPVGMESVTADKDTPVTFYSPNGIQLRRPQKGVNIIRKKGGVIEKVLIK